MGFMNFYLKKEQIKPHWFVHKPIIENLIYNRLYISRHYGIIYFTGKGHLYLISLALESIWWESGFDVTFLFI